MEGGEAENGRGFFGEFTFYYYPPNFDLREFTQSYSFPSLKNAHKYNCSFWVMLADSSWYATKNVGMYFSKDSFAVNQPLVDLFLSKEPQVYYSDTSFLENKKYWREVSGSFIAEGGEKYLIIGNFDKDTETQTKLMSYGGANIFGVSYWNLAYYYFDNVSVVEDTTYKPIGLEEELIKRIQIDYSNACLHLNGLLFQNQEVRLVLYGLDGREIISMEIPKGQEERSIPVSAIAPQVYLYTLQVKGEVVKRGKLLVN